MLFLPEIALRLQTFFTKMEKTQIQTEKEGYKHLLDVDAVFKKKGPKLYRFIPKFFFRYLKKITHEDELNDALYRLYPKKNFEFLEEILNNEFKVKIEVKNFDLLPETGRYIIVSNHPVGGIDGMSLMHLVGKKRPDLKSLSNDILLEVPPLKELFAPVNKHGRSTHETVKILDELFASDQVVLIFPAGLVSRKQKGGISDLEWKKTFISRAIKYQRDIVPVYIEGRNSDFFYNLARWRTRLGIKLNIEMLYLVDEMFKQRGKKITLTFGEPISYTTFTNELSHQQWAERMKRHIYKIAQGQLQFNM